MPAETELASVREDSIFQVLRLRHVAMPAPGSCMALAVVQALANDDLAQVVNGKRSLKLLCAGKLKRARQTKYDR
ncbi:hypothetical protein CCR75_002617 [Bremia lactucae]|uniref:Uncharacterized protein n=1 Tax=Bremia lactucae TaxID=4779 RepID=A0A976IL02_BRELC|nr:hypothetical protein CCR75_002617 [Bremia lactucae]